MITPPKTPLNDMVCSWDENVIEAMARMERNSKGILFITDQSGRFYGTVTDGDIRRGVLSTKSLQLPLKNVVNTGALFANFGDTDEVIEQKIKALRSLRDVKIVPILKDGVCVDFYESTPHFFVPISSPSLMGNELTYVHDCVTSGWISSQGSYVNRFEKIFSEKYGAHSAISVMNATCGLHLAITALGIGCGGEVIVPTLTFAASVNAILHTGAIPVFVDSKDDWCMDPALVESLITEKTKAIMPVHLYGQVCDMDPILALAKKHNLKVIEDCAEAQGATYKGKFVGTMGDVGCFSFFANKIMTTGEGGMNITNSPELAARMKKLRDHGKNLDYIGYFHDAIGFNYRMTNIQAAIGVAQMEKIESLTADRVRIQMHYERRLKDLKSLQSQASVKQKDVSPVCWLVSYVLDDTINREQFIKGLKAKGVDVRPFFMPMHEMEIYHSYRKGSYPVAERLGRQGVNLPTSIYMNEELIDQVIDHLIQTVKESQK